ncbi:MAG: PAS domain S-box protein [Halobacteriota archaeon]
MKTTPTLPHFGLDVVDDVPWGTHLCLFYETKEDLIEILVPYFAEGLRSNEACMWVTSEPLEQDEAIAALAKAVPNIDNFIKSGQLLTLPYTEWHIKGGTFDPDRVTHGWIEKEQEALNRGFEGLRLAGNTAWIERSLSDTFTDYEAAVNDVITEHRMIAVCPYSVEKCTGNDVIDVIRNHVGTIIKQGGTWAVVEDVLHRKGIETALQQEREELAAMNEALQSTNEELRVSNEELRYETEQRKRAEEQLRATSHYARSLLEASLDPLLTISAEGIITDVNEATEEATGYSRDELIGSDFSDYFTEPSKARKGYMQVFADGFVRDYPLSIRHKSGSVTDVLYNATVYRNERGNVQGVFAAARDITELKRTEEELRATSHYARSLLEASLDPLVTISAEGKITDVNKATEGVTGYSRDELIGSDFSDYFTEPDKANTGYQQVFADGVVRDYPLAVRHRSGKITDVLYNATIFADEQGNVRGVFAAARDITERKRAEEKVRAASLYARSLLEAGLDPLVTINARGEITDVNTATENVTGYSREELIGSDFSDYFTEPDKANASYQQVFADGVVRDYPLAVRHRSGKITDVLYNATIFADEHGNVRGVFAAARDITERKRAEEKVRAASLYARSLLEASLDPLVTINARGEITDVNTATENVTGYSRDELIGSDFSDYFTEPSKARKGYEETFLKGFVKDYPLSICHKSGRVTDVLYNATVYRNVAGDVQGVFAAARDITERKRAEEALQKSHSDLEERTAELARSNADLNQFAYVASHDLQEPLRAVVSYLQLLEKRYAGQLDERADKYITHAVEGGQRMQALVNDLLAYSRVETRGKALQSVNLENALDGALRNLSVAIEESGAVITHDPMPELKADRAQLTQVFQNLIGNAIKFRSDAPPEVHVGAQMLDDEWRFSVTDNGIGIDMRYADRIFTIFQRLHSRRAYSGTGIGLAICKRIIERHGGRIWVESDVGNGSSFYFTLKNR